MIRKSAKIGQFPDCIGRFASSSAHRRGTCPEAAGLGGYYQRRTTYSPDEYYGLIAPENLDSYFEEYLGQLSQFLKSVNLGNSRPVSQFVAT